MEKFEFENYRDELARELNETRKKDGGRAAAKEKLEEVRGDENYTDSKALHRIRNEFPRQVVSEAMDYQERVDDPTMWDVEDVSDKIPEEYKHMIDKATLHDISRKVYLGVENNKGRWDVDERIDKIREKPKNDDLHEQDRQEELLDKKIDRFRNELLGHRLLDNHNLNHLVMGHGGSAEQFRAKPFDRYSQIEASSTGDTDEDGFWMNTAGGHYRRLDRPAVVFSPDNLATRHFFEQKFYPPIEKLLEELAESEKKDPGSTFRDIKSRLVFYDDVFKGFGVRNHGDDIARLLFLTGMPLASGYSNPNKVLFFPFESREDARRKRKEKDWSKVPVEETWMDIADCVIDLRQRKVWKRKYSQEESDQVKVEKEKYKKWIEENLLHCSFEELIQGGRRNN